MRLTFPPEFSAALERLRGNSDFATVLAGVEHCANVAVHEAMRAPVTERIDATAWARGMRELSVHLIATTANTSARSLERNGVPNPTVETTGAMPPPPAPPRQKGAISGV